MFVDECFAGFFFCRVERVHFSNFRNEGVLEFDGMIERAMWRKDIVGLFQEDIGKGCTEVRDRDILRVISLSELG